MTFDGSTSDSSSYHNNTSVINPMNLSYEQGKVGNAVRFNGINQRATITIPANESLKFSNQMTVAYWVSLKDFEGMNGNGYKVSEGIHAIFSKDRDTNGLMYNYIVTAGGKNRFGVDNKYSENIADLSVDNWVHVAYVVSGNSITPYINGIPGAESVSITPISFASSNDSPLYIGRFQHNDYYPLNGLIDDFRMYNRALNAAEINSLYQLDS